MYADKTNQNRWCDVIDSTKAAGNLSDLYFFIVPAFLLKINMIDNTSR